MTINITNGINGNYAKRINGDSTNRVNGKYMIKYIPSFRTNSWSNWFEQYYQFEFQDRHSTL